MKSSREQSAELSHNPYESPVDVADEPLTGISPEESIAQHKAKFARDLRRIRMTAMVLVGLFLVGMTIASFTVMYFYAT